MASVESATTASEALTHVTILTLKSIASVMLYIVTFVTITVPSWLYSLISISLTFTISFSTLALIFMAFLSIASYLIRYRYHSYARTPIETSRKDAHVEVPDPGLGDSKPGLSNYLDEFLSAIKIFGYLDRPVFLELTRNMHTRRLTAGETFLLEEEQGFCLVVEGSVQIFVRTQQQRPASSHDSPDEDSFSEANHQKYQLLTEVKNGTPMSSLFSILSLFTEEVTTRGTEARIVSKQSSSIDSGSANRIHNVHKPNKLTRRQSAISKARQTQSQPSSIRASPEIRSSHLSQIPRLDLCAQLQEPPLSSDKDIPSASDHAVPSAHPDIVARATKDSTIAIIPATAFRRLTRRYPEAAAHIVHVILTRFYRVTLSTAHRYLGLTQAIIHIEKYLNEYLESELPAFLLGRPLDVLKDTFIQERNHIGSEEASKGIALHNPKSVQRRKRSHSSSTKPSMHPHFASTASAADADLCRRSSPVDERYGISAGDLAKASNGSSQLLQTPFPSRAALQDIGGYFDLARMPLKRAENKDNQELFREFIFQSMCVAIGIKQDDGHFPRDEREQLSPRTVSTDATRQKAVFNSVFGLMDSLESLPDHDTESNLSTIASFSNNTNSAHNLEDMIDDLEIVYFPEGTVLVDQQERMPGLYYVVDGFLDVGIILEDNFDETDLLGTRDIMNDKRDESSARKKSKKQGHRRRSLFLVKPGSIAGYLPAISGFRSFVDITAKSDVIVGFLPSRSLGRLVEKRPLALLTLAKRMTSQLDRSILHIDFALEYLQVHAGHIIYEQDQLSDSIYIILNGRLRGIKQGNDKTIQVLGEYGQGDSVGELEVLTDAPRPGSLHAIRDTELARIPKSLFNSLALEHPAISMKMSKVLAKRMRKLMYSPVLDTPQERIAIGGARNPSANVNVRTVGILPNRGGVPVADFANRLVTALTQIGTTVVSLHQSAILKHLGHHAFSKMGKLKLSQHLADLEEKYDIVLYIADTSVQSPWTSTCIAQSDSILVIGIAGASSAMGEYERLLTKAKTTARKELVLLHPERLCPPGLTHSWLRNRLWINGGHHHIQMPIASEQPGHVPSRRFGHTFKQRVRILQAEIQKYTGRRIQKAPFYRDISSSPFKSDFHRLARRLRGKSIGLVLGGGGARGIAHVGIIRALEEAGIPIDMVGGTSIGAFVGALYAWDAGVVPMYGRIKRFAGRMGSIWRFALDLTYPAASYTTGLEFNRGIWKTFANYRIEDLWLPFYCNTTNISKSCPEYHDSGYVWRYLRASMSLAGLLPPLCDDGNMLLDGGYIDNLTVAHMRSLGAHIVFAIDVGSLDDTTPHNYGDSLSGFWAIWNRYNPFSSTPNPPSLSEIQSRLAYVSSVDALERAKAMPNCHYMRPPIDPYGTLAFGEFDEIYAVGYEYAKKILAEMRAKQMLPLMQEPEEEKGDLRRTRMSRRASL